MDRKQNGHSDWIIDSVKACAPLMEDFLLRAPYTRLTLTCNPKHVTPEKFFAIANDRAKWDKWTNPALEREKWVDHIIFWYDKAKTKCGRKLPTSKLLQFVKIQNRDAVELSTEQKITDSVTHQQKITMTATDEIPMSTLESKKVSEDPVLSTTIIRKRTFRYADAIDWNFSVVLHGVTKEDALEKADKNPDSIQYEITLEVLHNPQSYRYFGSKQPTPYEGGAGSLLEKMLDSLGIGLGYWAGAIQPIFPWSLTVVTGPKFPKPQPLAAILEKPPAKKKRKVILPPPVITTNKQPKKFNSAAQSFIPPKTKPKPKVNKPTKRKLIEIT
jgi:hypothetical protein